MAHPPRKRAISPLLKKRVLTSPDSLRTMTIVQTIQHGETVMPKTITIAGHQFEIATPYEAGHPLTEGEAKALNQVRSENIRNNMAKVVKEKGADAAEDVAKYDADYEFTLASVGAGTRGMDPVEREARSIAREAIKAALAKKGEKIKDKDPDAVEAKIAEVAARPDVIKSAKKRVEEKKKAVEVAGVDLDDAAAAA